MSPSVPKPKRQSKAAKQRASFARAYGSPERVQWVSREACRVCGERPSENAHVGPKGKGTSRKADYDQIAPLCPTHHHLLHTGKLVVDRGTLAQWCADTQRAWLASSRTPDPHNA